MPTFRRTLALLFFMAVLATPQLAAQEADLTAVKSGPSEAAPGDDVPYSVTITNLGPNPAVNVTIVDNVPAGMTFVSATQTGGPAAVCTTPDPGDSGTITCTVAELAPAASLDFTFVFNIPPTTPGETTFTNVVTFTSDTFDPNEENNIGVASTTTPAVPQGDLSIEKNGPGAVGPGTTFSFTIALANGGPNDALNVTLQDTIPGDLQFVSLVQESGPAMSCTTPAVGAGGTITCTAATFAAGAEALFTLTTSVPAGTPSGTTYT
ncbi:MAG TPA: DUF11 domain-containing protein, partial [Thermoanaerobaculia bacterium]|nr:DUF11 domain-containing protein [Thermoanaerobaculia bacterium]